MKHVAVSQRIDFWPERNEQRDALDHRLVIWLQSAGFLAVPAPNVLGRNFRQWLVQLKPSAILLSSGNDLGEMPDRDETERTLLNFAAHLRLPVLGICRGMQMMAAHAGGSLKRVENHVRTRHGLRLESGMDEPWPKEVNSYHDYGLDGCPPDFRVVARSENDDEIELIRHRSLPWEGWMWHPERESVFSDIELLRCRKLFNG